MQILLKVVEILYYKRISQCYKTIKSISGF